MTTRRGAGALLRSRPVVQQLIGFRLGAAAATRRHAGRRRADLFRVRFEKEGANVHTSIFLTSDFFCWTTGIFRPDFHPQRLISEALQGEQEEEEEEETISQPLKTHNHLVVFTSGWRGSGVASERPSSETQ